MKKGQVVILAIISLLVLFSTAAIAEEKATPEECIQKSQEAAQFLKDEVAKGPEAEQAALDYMNKKDDNRFVWKDSYVWVLCCDCEPMTNAAHPVNQKIVGPDLTGLKDKKGGLFFLQFCEAAKNEKGGWVEYWWPKVDDTKASRKITYVLPVVGTKYQVAAGVYDDSLDAAQLSKLIQ